FKSSQEKVKLSHDKYAERVDGEYKALLTNLKDIEKQQQNFVSQTKLFERADSLKITLKNEIEDIRKDILLLDPINKKMKTLEGELIKMNKLSEEMYAKTTRYAAEKRRIDSMEKNFKQLLKISDTIDDKLETVTSSYDTLQEIKIRIRELGELGKEVQAQYERLEKKQEVLDTTTVGVDKSFRILEDLEKEIKRIDTTVEGLSPKMLTIDQEIKYLVENKPKADNAVEQMQKLNDLMSDIEERTQKLNKARDWLARTETRLESINKNAQDQLSMLKALMKEDGTNGKKIKGAPKQDKREMIIKLARQGWLSKEISKATNTSLGEVELILELEPKSR
ncbi:MAG: hypothetical protein JXJ04_24205, partial [Spirochaetales bacterium]|nr:hypothetical protein [Spirochaetales bacterium]